MLGLSGSLKQTSANTNILKAISGLAAANIKFTIYQGIDKFPFFRPEYEAGTEAIIDFRLQLKEADGVIICTPEYAFGVPGVLKNALDWLVSSGELNDKPVIAISASPLPTGGNRAMESLLLTLKALGTQMDGNSSLMIPAVSLKLNKDGQLTDEPTWIVLQQIFNHLLETIHTKTNNI
ncbi:MAG: NAD(P)H-dependent oxidoreductase [Bacteroidia bacterium]|nr:NAD(P)H-dependent oxidoreductase [Bacteroidia bacterium]